MNFEDDIDIQGATPGSELLGYRALWSGVLLQGLRDFAAVRAGREPAMKAEVEAWFWSDAEKGPGSIVWLCELVGQDPARLRARVLATWRTLVVRGKDLKDVSEI